MKRITKKLHDEKSAQKRIPDKEDFLLINHVYCGKCGAPLCGISDGNSDYFYECPNHGKGQCNLCDQSKDMIESVVRYLINDSIHNRPIWRLLLARMYYDKRKEENRDQDEYRASLKNDLKDTERKLDNLAKDISEGIFNESTQRDLKDLIKQIEEEEHRDSRVFRNMLRFYDGIVGDFDDEELRQFIFDRIVDKIYLHEEKMVITFRISDDTQELSYEETLEKIESLEQIMSFMGGE